MPDMKYLATATRWCGHSTGTAAALTVAQIGGPTDCAVTTDDQIAKEQ